MLRSSAAIESEKAVATASAAVETEASSAATLNLSVPTIDNTPSNKAEYLTFHNMNFARNSAPTGASETSATVETLGDASSEATDGTGE